MFVADVQTNFFFCCGMYRLATKRTVKTSGRKREREIFQT